MLTTVNTVGMTRACARLVPDCILTEEQKGVKVQMPQNSWSLYFKRCSFLLGNRIENMDAL